MRVCLTIRTEHLLHLRIPWKKRKYDDDDDKKKVRKQTTRWMSWLYCILLISRLLWIQKKKSTKSLPACEFDGTNYQRCDPSSMQSKDRSTCSKIDDALCGQKKKKMNRSDASYCKCIGLEPKFDAVSYLRGVLGN